MSVNIIISISTFQLQLTDLEEKKKEKSPEFQSNIEDILAEVEGEATLSCKVIGYPLPEVTWSLKGTDVKKLENSSNFGATFDGNVASLKVRFVHEEDAGMYTCSMKVTGKYYN